MRSGLYAHFFCIRRVFLVQVNLIDKIESLCEPVIAHIGFRLIEREFVQEQSGWVLRFYIDGPEVITVDDCATVSRALQDLLDVEDLIPHRYSLEVSSPGLDRPIRYPEDFMNFVGKVIRLKTTEQIDGRANFKGELTGFENDTITMTVDGESYHIPYQKLAKAKLVSGNF